MARVEAEVGARRPSLSELYERSAPSAVRLAYLLTGDRSVAEDITQDAFVRVSGRLAHLREGGAFDSYLRRAVVNLAKNLYSVSIAAEASDVGGGYFPVNSTLNLMRSVNVGTRRIEKVFGEENTMAYDGVWAPEGILFVRGTGQVNGFPARVDLAILEATGRHARGVVDLAVEYWAEQVWSPQVSPDGRTIAYVRNFEGADHVFLADLETGRTWELRRGFLASWVDAETLLVQDGSE